MSDRVQVAPLQGPEGLRPQANPVDAFTTPNVPKPDLSILDVAHALTDLNPQLQQFLGTQQKHINQKDFEAGQALAVKNKGDWKSAIDQGVVPAGASPWLRKGYEQINLQLQASQYDAAIKTAYEQSPVKNDDDPAALEKWVNEFSKTWIDQSGVGESKEFGHVFAPMAAQSHESLLQAHARDRVQAYEQGSKDKLFQAQQATLDQHDTYGPAYADTPGNTTQIADSLKLYADEMYKAGLDGTTVNRTTIDAITQKAVADGDMTVLDYMDKVDTGNGPLGNTQYGKQEREQAETKILAHEREMHLYQKTIGKDLMEAKVGEIKSTAVRSMLKDPTLDPGAYIKALSIIDPEHATQHSNDLLDSRIKMMENRSTDKEVYGNLRADISRGNGNLDAIQGALRAGKITKDDMGHLLDDFDNASKHTDLTDNFLLKQMDTQLNDSIKGNQFDFTPDKANKARQATNDYWSDLYQFSEKIPKPSMFEVRAHALKVQEDLIKHYGTDEGDAPVGDGVKPSAGADVLSGAATLDYRSKPLYPSLDALQKDAEKYRTASTSKQATATMVSELAAHYKVSPMEFIEAQYRIMSADKGGK